MVSETPYRAIRVGVTGARRLDPESRSLIERGVDTALATIREQLTNEGATEQPLLRLISPLAEGADRLVAQLALDQGYRLEAIFPFSAEDYRRDFFSPVTPGISPSDCVAEFDQLAAQAEGVLELDGNRDAENASYEAVGRAVVRNSDVVIAVWNGSPGAGRGGTADTVRFALDLGVPVWWVRTDTGCVAWLDEPGGIAVVPDATSTMPAVAELKRHLSMIFDNGTDHSPPLRSLGWWPFSHRSETTRPNSNSELPKRRFWFGAYGKFERLLTRGVVGDPYPVYATPDDRCWRYWRDRYESENNRANLYMSAYRSAFLLIFMLAAFILSMEGFSIAWPEHQITFKFTEVLAMALVALIVVSGKRQGWHMRAISHRLTAELIRKQSYLAVIGSALPVPNDLAENRDFLRHLRAAPLLTGRLDQSLISKRLHLVAEGLLHEQQVYHRNRHRKMMAASKRLAKIATILFGGGLIVAFGQLVSMVSIREGAVETSLALISAALPAFAAFAMGIRSYAELEIVAEQSARMEVFMRNARRKLNGFDSGTANASQALGEIVRSIAVKMLEDLQGWSTVSRSKALEAG